MTSESSPDRPADSSAAGDDQAPYEFKYGHGRMPFFMKLAWIAFLAFATIYVATYLLDALPKDLGQ